VWEDFVSEAAADYVLDVEGNRSFEDYLKGRMEITPLNGLGPRSLAYRQATAKNNAFIATRRSNMRELLQQANDRGVLPCTNYEANERRGYVGTGTTDDQIIAYSSESEPEVDKQPDGPGFPLEASWMGIEGQLWVTEEEPPSLVFHDLNGQEQLKIELAAADIADGGLDMIIHYKAVLIKDYRKGAYRAHLIDIRSGTHASPQKAREFLVEKLWALKLGILPDLSDEENGPHL